MLAIYCRISVDRAGQKSIKEQKLLGKDFAEKHGLSFEHYVDQGISGGGKSEKRPEFTRMLDDIEDGKVNAVFVWNQDRIAREELTWFQIVRLVDEKGIKLYDVNGLIDLNDESVMLMRGIKSMMDANFRRTTSKKIKTVLDRNAKEGKWKGIYPYGYKRGEDGKLTIDEEEAKIVKRIYALSLQGFGCRKIAHIFNDEEIPTRYQKIAQKGGKSTYVAVNTPRGKQKEIRKKSEAQWRDKTVRDTIKNTLYKGERIYNGAIYKIPAIFDKVYWKKVNDHLAQNRNTQHGNAKKYDYLLRGLMICGVCGKNYHGRVNKRDNYYMCTSKRFPKENCGNRAINRPFIEEFVWSKFFLSGEFDMHLEEYFKEQSDKSKLSVLRKLITKLNRDHSKLKKEAQEERKYLVSGTISEPEYLEDKKIRDLEEGKILNRISETETDIAVIENLNQSQLAVKNDLKAMSEKLSFENKQKFIAKYLDYIEVDYYGKIYYLRFHFKLSQMQPQLYYVEPNYALGFNITHQPLLDDYEVDWEKVYEKMVLNVTNSYWWEAAENMRKGTPGKFPYYPNARKVYLEVKKMEQEEKVRG